MTKPTIALFIADPKCSVQSGNGIMRALDSHYHFKIFGKNELEDNFFDNINMIAVPGGFGDSDSYDTLFKYNADRIRKFVQDGGKYLGICMGAYWAAPRYFDIVSDMDVVQYIKRDNADVRRSYATTAKVNWKGSEQNMFFYDGCAIIGDESKFDVIARNANGDPMAIIQRRVGLIGCHPESMKYWYEEPWQYLDSKWHDYKHHQLLIEFVDDLISRN